MRSTYLFFTLLIFGLVVLGGFAWASQNPDSVWLREAEAWPGVGSFVLAFRELYSEAAVVEIRSADEEVWIHGPPRVHGPPAIEIGDSFTARPPWKGVPEWVWAPEGTAIHSRASRDSAVLERLDAISNLARLERRGDWFRVWQLGREGWVHLPGYREDGPPLGNEPDPVKPVAGRPPDPELLKLARSLLGKNGEPGNALQWQQHVLYTDVTDDGLLALLEKVAARTESAHLARYRRPSQSGVRGAIVLYRDEAAYRALQARSGPIAGLRIAGHASRGVVALYVGRRSRYEVASTLVHELVHLVNPRTIGPALPPWLEEGLAADLASSRITPDGVLHVSEIGGQRLQWPGRTELVGPVASLWALSRQITAGRAPALAEVLARDWHAFVAAGHSHQSYGMAAFFVRYLLEDPQHAETFRKFLSTVAEGGDPSAEALRRELALEWSELDEAFRTWVRARAKSLTPRVSKKNQ